MPPLLSMITVAYSPIIGGSHQNECISEWTTTTRRAPLDVYTHTNDDNNDDKKEASDAGCTRHIITDLSKKFSPSNFYYFKLFLTELASSCFQSVKPPCRRFQTFAIRADEPPSYANFTCETYSECLDEIKAMRIEDYVKDYANNNLVQHYDFNYVRSWIDLVW